MSEKTIRLIVKNLNKGPDIFSNMSTNVSMNASGTEHYHPNEELLNILDTLRKNISNGKYSEVIQTEILESVECYVTGEGLELDPQIVKYLFQGWWVQDAMEKVKDGLESTEPFVCPLCFQEKIELAIDENKKEKVS